MSAFPTRSARPAAAVSPARRPRRIFGLLALDGLRRQRAVLRDMTDDQLRDLGITRAEADAEGRRPFWDLPAHWLR